MAIEQLSQVFDARGLTQTEKSVLGALANVAEKSGVVDRRKRAQSDIALAGAVTVQTVRTTIAHLEKRGYLTTIRKATPRRPANYMLSIAEGEAAWRNGHEPGSRSHAKQDPPANAPAPRTEYTPEFEEFWQAWAPTKRRVEKKGASKAYERALKSATHNQLLEGAERYVSETRGREPRFIKHPITWLNRGCWEDEQGSNIAPANYNGRGGPRVIHHDGPEGLVRL